MDDNDLLKLWKEFKEGQVQAKEALVERYVPVVHYLVSRVMIGLPSNVEEDDLVSYAMLGLLDAMERFEPERGIRFETFASTRIKGSILDGMRANDWVSRFTRTKIKEMERTFARLSQELGREPLDQEMAGAMELDPNEYAKLQRNASAAVVFSLDETFSFSDGEQRSIGSTIEDPNASVEQGLMQQDEQATLAAAIEQLPERERLLISLYYYEGLTLKEIGQVLNVTESRVCQLHQKVILRLRSALSNT